MSEAATLASEEDEAGRSYRPCVGIALFDVQGRVFLGRRRGGGSAPPHAWQMPQGGIDAEEAPYEAALRELREETNVRSGSVTLLAEMEGWLTYDLPPELLKRSWKGRYRGQSQKWFALGFTGRDEEIDILRPGDGCFVPEFDAWRWGDLAETPALIVPFKRRVYDEVAASFAPWTRWRGLASA